VIDGVAIGKAIRAEVAAEVTGLSAQGIRPGLAVVLVGENPASQVYVRAKGKACEEAGMKSVTLTLPRTPARPMSWPRSTG
jgi:methylenetetrahydrofolate dehydrogenase (NADP+)/methenyltetrahydrofolate cyclohydrolase